MSTKITFHHLQNFFLKTNLSEFIKEIFTYLLLRCITLLSHNMKDIKLKLTRRHTTSFQRRVYSDLKAIKFGGNLISWFPHFLTIFTKFCTHEKFQNNEISKLNTCRVWDFLFPNIWWKYDIDIRISHVSTYSNKTRVSVTCMMTITLINNRKSDIQWDFRLLFSLKSRN